MHCCDSEAHPLLLLASHASLTVPKGITFLCESLHVAVSTSEPWCYALQRVIQLEEGKWRALSSAVLLRLKRLMAGVADPESVRRQNEARAEQARLAAIQKAESNRLKQKEKQR